MGSIYLCKSFFSAIAHNIYNYHKYNKNGRKGNKTIPKLNFMKGYCTYGATSIDLQINFKKFRIQALKELEVKICQKTLYMKKRYFLFVSVEVHRVRKIFLPQKTILKHLHNCLKSNDSFSLFLCMAYINDPLIQKYYVAY